jgi:uncharacterized protein (TIGR03663 family)
MSSTDGPAGDPDVARDRSRLARLARADAVTLVVAVTVLALAARLLFLGDRIAHWDEARVAYWIVHYQETGSFAYRRIIHGPFIQHVNRWVFATVGANDFTMRAPVAIVGGLLPLSALCFRKHLRRGELVAMALLLSFNPVLLYYSRFMRSDLLVATFMFVAFGLLVRAYDTRLVRYVVASAAFAALGFTAKENAIVYLLTWAGALGLLADQALFRPRRHSSGYAVFADRIRGVYRRRLAGWFHAIGAIYRRVTRQRGPQETTDDAPDGAATTAEGPSAITVDPPVGESLRTLVSPFRFVVYLGVTALVALAVLLFFYAPRGAGMAGIEYPPAAASAGVVGLWEAVGNPGLFPELVSTTWEHASAEFSTWFGRATESGNDKGLFEVYVEFLGRFLRVMGTKAAAVSGFAVFGFALERYGAVRSRNLVLFASYCGFVSVLGYPLGTDIFGAWITVHAVVPLSIPAAVGVARVGRWATEAVESDDVLGVAIAAVLLLLVAGQVGGVLVGSVYTNDTQNSNHLVQYAQPGGEFRSELALLGSLGGANDSATDVVIYYGETGSDYDGGDAFVEREGDWNSSHLDLHPLCTNWYNTLPLPWYLAKDDVETACERSPGNLSTRIDGEAPPMIITQQADSTVPRDALEAAYVERTYKYRVHGSETTFWVRTDLAE